MQQIEQNKSLVRREFSGECIHLFHNVLNDRALNLPSHVQRSKGQKKYRNIKQYENSRRNQRTSNQIADDYTKGKYMNRKAQRDSD